MTKDRICGKIFDAEGEDTMLKTNWHTHTNRCGHAVGTDEEYVKNAIAAGVKTLGFSDHAPYRVPYRPERMDYSEYGEYKASVLNLKKKYRDQIDIYLGMEVEMYPTEWEDLCRYRKELDYCILGQHNISLDRDSSYGITDPDTLKRYVDRIEEACQRGLCDYIAHPDVCMYSYPVMDESVRAAAARIADISIRYDMPVELNCGSGVREGKRRYDDGIRYSYPTRMFFEEFAKRQCKVVIGLDIHDPALFLTDKYINRALAVIEGLDCNVVEDYDLIAAAAKRKAEMF